MLDTAGNISTIDTTTGEARNRCSTYTPRGQSYELCGSGACSEESAMVNASHPWCCRQTPLHRHHHGRGTQSLRHAHTLNAAPIEFRLCRPSPRTPTPSLFSLSHFLSGKSKKQSALHPLLAPLPRGAPIRHQLVSSAGSGSAGHSLGGGKQPRNSEEPAGAA